MKAFLAYGLLTLVLAATFQDAVMYLLFYGNRTYLAQERCVRPEEPITVCGGSCVLQAALSQQHEEEQPQTFPTASEQLVFTTHQHPLPSSFMPDIQKRSIILDERLAGQCEGDDLFRPPRV